MRNINAKSRYHKPNSYGQWCSRKRECNRKTEEYTIARMAGISRASKHMYTTTAGYHNTSSFLVAHKDVTQLIEVDVGSH